VDQIEKGEGEMIPENMRELINQMSREECLEVNRMIVEQMRRWDTIRMVQFHIGQEVYFETKTRGAYTGKVQKINQKSITVVTDAGMVWKVHPNLLYPRTSQPSSVLKAV
jgi:hypothetical protein